MEAVQEIQVLELDPAQLSGLERNVVLFLSDILFILAAIAAHDNRWDY